MGVIGLAGEQTLSPPREVRVLQGVDWVLGFGHLGERSLYRSSQGCRSLRVAHSKEQDGRSDLPRLYKLLLKVHSELLYQSSTPLWLNMLQTSLDMEWKGTGSLWRPQNSGDHCSSVSVSSGIRPLPDWSRQLRLRYRNSLVSAVNEGQKMAFYSIL